MREEGVVYDLKTGRFLHVYSDGGKTIIDKQPCQHDHFVPVRGS